MKNTRTLLQSALGAFSSQPRLHVASSFVTSIASGFRFLSALLIAVAASWAQYAPAGLIFNFTDDGTDTTVNWSGTLNTVGLTVDDTADLQSASVILGTSPIIAAMDSSAKLRFDRPFASRAAFATSGTPYTPTNRTGDNIGLNTLGFDLFVPQGYTSGSPLSGSFQILGQTVASMGIFDSLNAFVLTNGDRVAVVVPEPSTYAMALASLACCGYLVARRRKRA